MYFDWLYFLTNLVTLACSAFLCLFTVRERLKVSLARASLVTGTLIAAFCALVSMEPSGLANILMPIFLVPCFFVYQKVVREVRGKLLFIFFVVATYICFASALRILILNVVPEAPLFTPPSEDYISIGTLLVNSVVMLSCFVPACYVLRRKIWPLIRDLEIPEWTSLWLIPMIHTLVIIVFTEQYWNSALSQWLYFAGMILLGMGAFVSYYLIVRMMNKSAQFARAQEQARMMEHQLELERVQYETLSDGINHARQARHDIRHSLAALQGYVNKEDTSGLKMYLNQLIGELPAEAEPQLCENFAVNAVARHYLGLARESGAAVTTKLDIPRDIPHASEVDLCVLFGNMLENAAEACTRTAQENRFISANALRDGAYLTIAITNSFDGDVRIQDGVYLSRKHSGEGIGISSVQAIAEKYDGYASFAAHGNVFESSAVVRLFKISPR